MKKEFTKENLKAGDYLIRLSANESDNHRFGPSVTFKVCWMASTNQYGLCAVTDGMVLIYDNKQALVDYLNTNDYGFKHLSKRDYQEQIEGTMQGFDQSKPESFNSEVLTILQGLMRSGYYSETWGDKAIGLLKKLSLI